MTAPTRISAEPMTAAALDWRGAHLVAVRAFIALAILHIVAVALHLLDFVRD